MIGLANVAPASTQPASSAVPDASVHITRARGGHKRPYVVAQFIGSGMRIAHAVDLPEANAIATEWRRRDYSFNRGELRRLQCKRTAP